MARTLTTAALNRVPGGGVDDPVELVVGDGLGVEVVEHGLLLQVLVRPEQGLPNLTLPRPGVANWKLDKLNFNKNDVTFADVIV